MKNWIWHCSGVRFIGFENEEEAFVVCCCKSGKCGDFLERLVVFNVGEFEGSDEGC